MRLPRPILPGRSSCFMRSDSLVCWSERERERGVEREREREREKFSSNFGKSMTLRGKRKQVMHTSLVCAFYSRDSNGYWNCALSLESNHMQPVDSLLSSTRNCFKTTRMTEGNASLLLCWKSSENEPDIDVHLVRMCSCGLCHTYNTDVGYTKGGG